MNLKRDFRILLLALAVSLGGLALAGEPVAPPEKEQPAAGKVDQAGKPPAAATEKAPPSEDPTAVVGTAPVFPLKSEFYEQIEDDQKKQPDINMTTGLMELDLAVLNDVLLAVRASSQEHLRGNIDPQATFDNVMRHSEQYRGHVMKISGVLRNIKPVAIPNETGIINLWRGQITTNNNMLSFQCMEPPGNNGKEFLNKPVTLVGIYVQRYAYLDGTAGQVLRWTPLLVVRRLEPGPVVVTTDMNSPTAIVIFVVIGLMLGALFYSRLKSRYSAINYFTRKKAKREGPPTLFPRPDEPRKHHLPERKPPGSAGKDTPAAAKAEAAPAVQTPPADTPPAKPDAAPGASGN